MPELAPRCDTCHRRHRFDLPCWRLPYSTAVTTAIVTPGARCWLRLPGCKGAATTVDHIVPRSRGGGDEPENCRPACVPCNRKRGDREPFAPSTPTRPEGRGLSPRWRDL